MRKYIFPIAAFVVVACVTMILLTKAQTRPEALDPKTARELLDGYAKMLEGTDMSKAGLPSAEALKTATLANPRHVLLAPLDKLRALDSVNGSIGSILNSGPTTFYEVRSANGAVLALMEVGMKDGKYMAASFGHKAMAEAIASVGANNPTGDLVRIQALHLDFLANNSGGIATYMALQNVPEFGIRQGASFTDKDLIRILQPFARQYNGFPL
jgi:hypothetical protein